MSDEREATRAQPPGTDWPGRLQWRIMWTHATGCENGARWRDDPPTAEELAEWCVDFNPLALRVEQRTVYVTPPEHAREFDVFLVDKHTAKDGAA